MRTRRITPSLLCVALLTAASTSANAFRIDYTVDFGIEHDDNVLMSPTDAEDSNALRAGFGFAVSEETSAVRANAGGRFEYFNYLDGPRSNAFESSLSGRLDWFLVPETFSFTIEDVMEMRPIDRFAADTVDNRQRVNVLSLGPNLQFNWSRAVRGLFELRWIDSRAEEDDDLESQRISAALHAIRELDPTSSLSLSLRGQDVDFEHDLMSRDHRRYDGYIRYQKQLNRLGFGLDAGYTWVDYADGSSPAHPMFRARLDWAVSARSTLTFGAAHQLTDSSDSALAGITATAGVPDRLTTASTSVTTSLYEEDRFEATWSHRRDRLGLMIGPYYERVDFLDATAFDETRRGLVMQVTYRLAPTWDLRGYADVARSDFNAIDLRTEDRRYGFGIAKTWSRHWSSALDYVHYRRDADGALGDSRQNVWYLTVTYRNR